MPTITDNTNNFETIPPPVVVSTKLGSRSLVGLGGLVRKQLKAALRAVARRFGGDGD
ncbi:uncharacterized protein PHALS_06057 [Plasmopara halstedii]|uniref:Uncharacterized protein n=1 Tax=Plasmopara halstedii TaxID=4781 RepID=A0A0P1AC53_PLAHL|nr:uncharacterized protein PHALS_06057 [Plasmopara halstedii]CEG38015.1 hypothetical protein PHALS_06057 [Plasmopara halstedii]|eukprot:XP_024574384.1 hypothetical protein PHALS_06057 [Plasmopara halstedii]